MTRPNTIRKLSDSALLNRLNALSDRERVTTLEILLHLSEVDRRELYLGEGFSSLFAYCTGRLEFSESAAGRRVRAARCIRTHPEIGTLLHRREVNISTVSRIAGVIDGKNKRALLKAIRGKSQREVERVIARYQPERRIRDRVRPVAILKTISGDATPETDACDVMPGSDARIRTRVFGKWQEIYRRSGGKKLATTGGNSARTSDGASDIGKASNTNHANGTCHTNETSDTHLQTIIEQKFELKFAVSPEFMKKLNEVKALLSNRYPAGIEFEPLFGVLLDEFIDRHSPRKKQERRETRKIKRPNTRITEKNRAKFGEQKRTKTPSNKRTRYIAPATRDRVYTRDGGMCTYVARNGRRCGSTWGLQIDHIKPFARGGTNRLDNLRLLCGKHNRLEAERVLGVAVTTRRRRRE